MFICVLGGALDNANKGCGEGDGDGDGLIQAMTIKKHLHLAQEAAAAQEAKLTSIPRKPAVSMSIENKGQIESS